MSIPSANNLQKHTTLHRGNFDRGKICRKKSRDALAKGNLRTEVHPAIRHRKDELGAMGRGVENCFLVMTKRRQGSGSHGFSISLDRVAYYLLRKYNVLRIVRIIYMG